LKPTNRTPRLPPSLVIASYLSLALAVVVLFGFWPLRGGDLLMWLTVGRYTWEHGWPTPG
jgi:hypothetical protein